MRADDACRLVNRLRILTGYDVRRRLAEVQPSGAVSRRDPTTIWFRPWNRRG